MIGLSYDAPVQDDTRPEIPADLPTVRCPFCGTLSTQHPASECLDRWVHHEFLGRVVAAAETVPPYSCVPQHPCLSDVIRAAQWAESAAVMQTAAGCSVGILVREDGAYEHYHIVASAESLPLAICRAAVGGFASGGRNPLQIR